MNSKMKVVLILFFSFSISFSQVKDTIFVANWNIENLFDTIDDVKTKDEEFTPNGANNWTEERLNHKVLNLSKVISEMNCGKGPDIIAFEEVEHKSMLELLFSKVNNGDKYEISYTESQDIRGIDVGLAFRKDKFQLLATDTIVVPIEKNRTTRYVFYNKLQANSGEIINIFVNHWSSRAGGEEKSESNRISAANVLKGYMSRKEIKNNVIIIGDFNDEPHNTSIACVLSAKKYGLLTYEKNDLVNLSSVKDDNNEGSYLYQGVWGMIDQIIVSQDVVKNSNLKYLDGSYSINKLDYLLEQEGKYKGSPFRTFGGKKYLGGYTDHLAVYAKFVLSSK